jgi:hypothetical protein
MSAYNTSISATVGLDIDIDDDFEKYAGNETYHPAVRLLIRTQSDSPISIFDDEYMTGESVSAEAIATAIQEEFIYSHRGITLDADALLTLTTSIANQVNHAVSTLSSRQESQSTIQELIK